MSTVQSMSVSVQPFPYDGGKSIEVWLRVRLHGGHSAAMSQVIARDDFQPGFDLLFNLLRDTVREQLLKDGAGDAHQPK